MSTHTHTPQNSGVRTVVALLLPGSCKIKNCVTLALVSHFPTWLRLFIPNNKAYSAGETPSPNCKRMFYDLTSVHFILRFPTRAPKWLSLKQDTSGTKMAKIYTRVAIEKLVSASRLHLRKTRDRIQ